MCLSCRLLYACIAFSQHFIGLFNFLLFYLKKLFSFIQLFSKKNLAWSVGKKSLNVNSNIAEWTYCRTNKNLAIVLNGRSDAAIFITKNAIKYWLINKFRWRWTHSLCCSGLFEIAISGVSFPFFLRPVDLDLFCDDIFGKNVTIRQSTERNGNKHETTLLSFWSRIEQCYSPFGGSNVGNAALSTKQIIGNETGKSSLRQDLQKQLEVVKNLHFSFFSVKIVNAQQFCPLFKNIWVKRHSSTIYTQATRRLEC